MKNKLGFMTNAVRKFASGTKMSLGLGATGASRIGGITGAFAGGALKFGNLKGYKEGFSALRDSKGIYETAKASAGLLGRGSGIVMTSRALQGRNPIKNKRGKLDVPFVPFI